MTRSTLIKSLLALPMVGMLAVSTPALADKCPSQCNKSKDKTVQVAAQMDIVDTAVAAGSFKTLAAALGAADLVDALKSDGPFTVFAQTDEAFAKLPKGTVETLLKPENKDKLVAILKYHVVPGKVKAKDVVALSSAKTAEGSEIAISVNGEKVKVDAANVVKTDIACSNGVIHVIDAVITPKQGG